MKLIRSFFYAGQGIKYCFKNELNFRIHTLATIVVIAMGIYFSISETEWLFIIFCCMLVLAMEMLNTAMERMCDLFSKEFNPLIKFIKDVCAGAVLLCAMGSLFVAAIIFIPKIILQIKLLQ